MFYHLKESRTLGVWIWYVHWANKKVDTYVGLQQNVFYPISAVQNYSTPDTSTIPNKSWVLKAEKMWGKVADFWPRRNWPVCLISKNEMGSSGLISKV